MICSLSDGLGDHSHRCAARARAQYSENHLLPDFLRLRSLEIWFSAYFGPYKITKGLDSVVSDDTLGISMAGLLFRRFSSAQRAAAAAAGGGPARHAAGPAGGPAAPASGGKGIDSTKQSLGGMIDLKRPLDVGDAERMIYFEKLFFTADSDSNGYLKKGEALQLLSYLRSVENS